MTSIREFVGDASYATVALALDRAFPDPRSIVDDATIDTAVVELWKNLGADGCAGIQLRRPADADIPAFEATLAPAQAPQLEAVSATGPVVVGYYTANATHTRKYLPKDAFLGEVPMARVTLAKTTQDAKAIDTKVGTYDPKDHLYASASQLAWKYSAELGPAPVTRVDVITGMRQHGARFGAIGVYLGFRSNQATPSFYVLEAGFATGQAAVAFLSPHMSDVPPSRSYYQPTPFASDRNFYAGHVDLTAAGDLARLIVQVRNQPTIDPHLTVDVAFVRDDANPNGRWPSSVILEAAARVGYIAQVIGMQTPEVLFAPIGAHLPWIHKPEG